MNIRLLAPAQVELDEAIDWYAQQAPGLGEAFLLEALKVLKLIEQYPQAWHPLTTEIRRCRLKRFPYSVVYTMDIGSILVLAVAHQHRKPDYWRNHTLSNHWPCAPKPSKSTSPPVTHAAYAWRRSRHVLFA